MVRTIKDLRVIIDDVCNANTIYRCDVTTLKGKTSRQQLNRVQSEYIEVPDSLRENIGKLKVAADVMFVKKIPFVVSGLRGVNFIIVEYFTQRSKTVIAISISKIFQFYKNNGYTIKKFLMNREFECITLSQIRMYQILKARTE